MTFIHFYAIMSVIEKFSSQTQNIEAMKKIIVLFAICALAFNAFAQTNSDDVYYTASDDTTYTVYSDGQSSTETNSEKHKTAGQVIKDLHPQVFVQSNGQYTTAGVSVGNGNWNVTVSGSTSPYGNSVGISGGVGGSQYSTNQYPNPNGGNYSMCNQQHTYTCQGCGVTNNAYVVGPCQ